MKSASQSNLVVDMLTELLKAYSPTGEEHKAVLVLKDYASALGYEEIHIDEVGNLIASYGDGEVSIAFIGHIDTVPGELPTVFDGVKISGRGAVDAKGPLAALFIGASQARAHVGRGVKVYSIAVVGEEGDSRGAKNLISRGFKVDASIIAEPTNNIGIAIGYRGSIKLKVQCSSGGGHTSSPILEDSACISLLKLWEGISGRMHGFKYNENSASLLYISCGEYGRYSIYPRYGEMVVDIRVSVDNSLESVMNLIDVVVGQVNSCKYTIMDCVPPIRVNPNNPTVRALVRAVLKQNKKPRILYKLGTSDMNILYPHITSNMAAYGPGRSELSHSDKEEVSIDELIHGINVYREAAIELSSILIGRES